MYKLALTLSTTPSRNLFRSALVTAIHSGYLDNFLVCSGFFHERSNSKGRFYASDAFVSAILPNQSEITVVGAYDPASAEFDDFVNKLSLGLKTTSGAGVTVNQRRSIKKYANRWHAKIFIARQNEVHRFAIIGSSNLTRNAFGTIASNNEADVLIWDDGHSDTQKLATTVLASTSESNSDVQLKMPEVIVFNHDEFDPRNSGNISMDKRLMKIWQDVLLATN